MNTYTPVRAKSIYCCGCKSEIKARLTDGREIYPHRGDLKSLPFWKCDECKNFVGCHHKTSEPTRPLGCIPTPEIKAKRQAIHRILDTLWKSGRFKRGEIYQMISDHIGGSYHTAEIQSVDEAQNVLEFLQGVSR